MSKNTDLDFQQVKYKFNQLIEFGLTFGNNLIKNNKNKNKKTILTSLNTPYDYNENDERATKQHVEIVEKDSIKAFVKRIFTHYDVNPSDDEYSKRILNTYVNEKLEVIPYLIKRIPDVINENDKIFDDIKNLVNKIRDNQTIHQEERKIYITGIRGSGKTSYLNYFISKYEKDLNELKIISIRVNVRRIKPCYSLEDAIKFKICRILFTYYCTREQKGSDRLKARVIKNSINKYLEYIQQNIDYGISPNDVNECSDRFKGYDAKETRDIWKSHRHLCELLLRHVVEDYKFVIMLDDFDQVKPNDKEIYDMRMAELDTISTSFLFNHSIYLIAVRYSTFNALPNNTRTESSCRVIGTPTTFDMLNKRFTFFTSLSRDVSQEKKEKCLKNLIMLIGNNFIPNTNSVEQPLNFEQACGLFDSIFYGNKRIIVNMINRFIDIIPNNEFELLCEEKYENNYDNIFDKLISQTYYKFFESLLINTDTGFCNDFFKYNRENERYEISPIKPTAHFDENFIPNIYHFPAVPYSENVQFIPFLKIRILQLLKSYNNKDSKLCQNEIVKILRDIFGYQADVVHLACKELRWDQSIIIIEEEPDNFIEQKERIRTLKVDITSRGKRMLNILPVNINLLAVALENVYLPISLLKTGMPIGNYNNEDISKFIIRNKFFSLPKMIGLLKSIEEYEKDVLLKRNPMKYQEIFDIETDFGITEQLQNMANHSIERIFYSYFENNEQSIKRKIKLKMQLETSL